MMMLKKDTSLLMLYLLMWGDWLTDCKKIIDFSLDFGKKISQPPVLLTEPQPEGLELHNIKGWFHRQVAQLQQYGLNWITWASATVWSPDPHC